MPEFNVYAICFDTSDYPNKFTVRRHDCSVNPPQAKELLGVRDTLNEARKLVPFGLAVIPRDPDDDPVIVETWL